MEPEASLQCLQSLPVVPIQSHMNPIHNLPPCFPKIHSTIILSSTPWFSERPFPFRFSDQTEGKRPQVISRFETNGVWNSTYNCDGRFEVFTAVKVQVAVFWIVIPCSDVSEYQGFGGPCCLHFQGKDGCSMVLWMCKFDAFTMKKYT